MTSLNAYNDPQRSVVSTLWTSVLLAPLVAQLNYLIHPAHLFELLGGYVNDRAFNESHLLISGLVIYLQLLMTVACRVLSERSFVWVNLVVATVSILVFASIPLHSVGQYLVAALQLFGLSAILWMACIGRGIEEFLLLIAPPIK